MMRMCFILRECHRSFGSPDETRSFANGKAEILRVGDSDIGRLILQPGWRWSNDVKPLAGTESCEAPHFQYHISGRLAVRMDDGTEFIAGPGDVTSLPKGHDAWVVGDEPVVVVDWYGASNYAKADWILALSNLRFRSGTRLAILKSSRRKASKRWTSTCAICSLICSAAGQNCAGCGSTRLSNIWCRKKNKS